MSSSSSSQQQQQPPPESKLLAKFSDGITGLSYLPNSQRNTYLACASWDGTLQLHDTSSISTGASSSSSVLTQTMDSGPLLSLATPSNSETIVTGGLDGSVKMFNYTSSTTTLLGRHSSTTASESSSSSSSTSNACSCLVALSGGSTNDINNNNNIMEHSNLIASASWNRQFCLWDIRSPGTAISTINLPGKAFSMDMDYQQSRIVVATSGRRNCIVDIRKTNATSAAELVLDRESSLKYQTRCIRFFPSGQGFALGSVEGRVGVEYLDELMNIPSSMKRFAFKCHRVNDTIYPVNCIAFHPRFTSTFATGGCDGTVVLWDSSNKKKLTSLPSFPTSVSAIAFNHDGSELAVASSYTFEDGDREHPQDEVFVRRILDSECQPKQK